MGTGRSVKLCLIATAMATLPLSLCAQTSVRLTEPPVPLLPRSFAGWKQTSGAAPPAGAFSLTGISQQALEECGPQRSLVEGYARDGRTMRLEAVEFGDRTGAYSAFTLVERPEMRPVRGLGEAAAAGDDAVLFTQGDTLVLASPAGDADVPALRELTGALPKVSGGQGVAPLLPSLAPGDHLVPGSLRYALGPATYAAEGGVLPANSLGWSKSAEAVTATYDEKHGRETLTLVLYPTPQIAEAQRRALSGVVGGLGPAFATARVRRENEMVMLASGSLPSSRAQALLEGVHLRQEVSIDRYMPPVFHAEVQKTFSLLENIALLFAILGAAAVLLGLFLGGGRALFRVMRGKSAASEPEFLSLHLAPQNAAPHFDATKPSARF